MRKVDEYQFYKLATAIFPLTELKEGTKVVDAFPIIWPAKQAMVEIYNDKFVPPLRICKPICERIWRTLVRILPDQFPAKDEPQFDFQRPLEYWEANEVSEAAKEFATVLAAECQSLDTYHCSQKLAFNTSLLIDAADNLIPASIRSDLSAATIEDIRQAGRCIAFEIPTAAGFHIVRATEGVIREYYQLIVGTLPPQKVRNWGAYIRILETRNADRRVTGFLDHIRSEYRNPVLHPDQTLSNEQALVFLNICISSIVQMITAIQQAKATPLPLPFPKQVNGQAETATA